MDNNDIMEILTAKEIFEGFSKDGDKTIYLSSFVNQAESFNSKNSDVDIVKEYLLLSGNGHEILQLTKAVLTSDLQIAVLIMKVLCHILLRVVNDLNVFSSVAASISNEILSYGMKTIITFLKVYKKPARTKLALHILSSMVALGGPTAHQVVSKLDFSNITFTHLFGKKNFSEEEDIRTAFINFIILIITTCEFAVIRQLVEIKGFLNDILAGLESDRPHVIISVLSTFRKLIVENTGISKTTKLKLFNDRSLKPVIKLYSWKGPIRNKTKGKRKLGEEEVSIAFEVSKEEIANVQLCAHEFMLSLCCSFKSGIIFRDSSVGSSGKNQNHVLTNILAYLPKPHTNKLAADFVIEVLKTCPDQMVYYLPCLKSSCTPRPSALWINAITVIKKIILAQDLISCLFKHEEKKLVSILVNIAKSVCFPCVLTSSDISNAFKKADPVVCYHLCDYLICILNQIKSIAEFCIQADVTKTAYSAADISAFSQSFLTTIFQNFSFMQNLEDLWDKLTLPTEDSSKETLPVEDISKKTLPVKDISKETSPVEDSSKETVEETQKDLPSYSAQLAKILEVIQQYLLASHYGYHRQYEVNVPKLFQSLKQSYSLLTREEICNLNIKIVDIIAAQGEEAIMLWNKSLIDSPLMVLLDVYMTSPLENMIDDVLKVLHKILVYTNVFEFCPWETDIWLESMKSSKTKHIPLVIEFINSIVCSVLQNPNMFSDDITETTVGKNSSQISMDVTSTLNDLLSTDKDPILIENFEEFSSVSSVPKLCFSSLVPASLFTLRSLDPQNLKGCQPYVEKVLYHLMHHQQSPQGLFSLIKKYKDTINDNLYYYFELLCYGKDGNKISIKNEDCKTRDLSKHLQMKFIALHTLQTLPVGYDCDVQFEPQHVGDGCKEKIVWQLMTYIDWEINMFLEDKIQNTDILNYISLLEKLLDLPDKLHHSSKVMEAEVQQIDLAKYKIFEQILTRPSVLRCFLWTEKLLKPKRTFMKEYVNSVTRLILKLVQKVISCKESHEYLVKFKEKVIKFISYHFEIANLPRNIVMYEIPEICDIISIFSTVYSNIDVTYMLEDLLNLDTKNIKIENHFSALSLVFKLYLELKDFMLLSPKAVSSLFVKYTQLTKKEKKTMKDYVTNIFQKHPILASVVNVDSCLLLLKQPANKNFYVLGCLIDCSKVLKHTIQAAIIEDLDNLMNTPDFIYLTSKCILNSSNNDMQDVEFLDKIVSLFWEKATEYIMIDVASADMLLENSGTGKAVQVLCKYQKLTEKSVLKFFKNHFDILNSTVPSSSKMVIFLQFMEVLKLNSSESRKSTTCILKLVTQWLVCIVSSLQNISEFNYFPLIQFMNRSLQNILEVNMTNLVEAEIFFQKILKVAMKHKPLGSQLIDILVLLLQKSEKFDIPTRMLFNLVSGHSNFFNIMLSQIKENDIWRESIVDLLITLVNKDRSVCQDNHLGLILSSYTGSLKSVDRKLLYLIKLYSESDVNMTKFSPFLWSKTAIVHYSVMNVGTMHLWKKPKQQDLLSIFSSEMLQTTAEKYPLMLKLEPCLADSDSLDELKTLSELDRIYDLRFFLPLFANLLSPGAFLHCRSFMDSKVVMLIFVSLSSFDANTRALGYYCLSQLYFHLEGANYAEKEIWLSLLDSLRNSITSDNPRIPSIVTLFLAKVTHIFNKPDHPLFTVLCKFIMVKPSLDIGHVPEFYKLFNSLEIEHRIQRMWLLNLLSSGLRSSLDFHICEKRNIFSLILTHFWSSVSSHQEKAAIMDIVSAAVKIDTSARLLGQNALLSWLHNVIETLDSTDVTLTKSLCCLLRNFWFSCKKFCKTASEDPKDDNDGNDESKTKILSESFLVEFLLVILSFIKNLKILDGVSMKSYLLTLHDVMTLLRNSNYNIETSLNLTVDHISEILEAYTIVSVKQERNETKDYAQKNDVHLSPQKELTELVLKIILLWSPNWKLCNELYYSKQQSCILKAVQLMSQFCDLTSLFGAELPTWLYKCCKDDKSHGLVKLFLASENEFCFRLILDFYEKSLVFSNQFINTNNDKLLYFEARETVSHKWCKILSYFKKVCKNCNLTPDLNVFNQINLIL